jgi:uncharacterized membrane protein YeaQ/YmgE (transglycosylase-associated protein family)
MSNSLIWTLVIGIVAGFLAGKIMKGSGFGLLGDLVVGCLGAWIGSWVYGLLGITTGGILGIIVMAVIGACLLLYVIRLVKKA